MRTKAKKKAKKKINAAKPKAKKAKGTGKRGRPKKVKESQPQYSQEAQEQTTVQSPAYLKLRATFPDLTEEDFVGSIEEIVARVSSKTGKPYGEIEALVVG